MDVDEDIAAIPARLAVVRREIAEACGEDHEPVRLVAVSKLKSVAHIRAAYAAGQRVFGENYAQELAEKAPQLPDDIEWHMIGKVQSSNCKHVLKPRNLALIESIDCTKLASKFNTLLEEQKRTVAVYVQVNTSGEDSKSGCPPEEAVQLCKFVHNECPALKLSGLMTIGKLGSDGTSDFQMLAELRAVVAKELGLRMDRLQLSMGMSGDFAQAIHYGSTNVRVGSKIFGDRPPKEHH